MTRNYIPWNTDCACSLLKLLLPPSLKYASGRWVKDVLKIRDWLPPRKLRRPSVIAKSTMRGGHVYCVREKAIHSFNIDFTCAHGGGNNCKRHSPLATKIMHLLKKFQLSCLKLPEAKQGEGRQDIIRAEAMMCDLLVIKTCNHHNPWIYWCF